MTAKILRMANSAYYASRQRISTVTRAVVILGFNTVKNIILGLTAFSHIKGDGKAHEGFAMHCLICAVCARMLAEKIEYEFVEESFVAGLIHDLGQLILERNLPNEYAKVKQLMKGGVSRHVAENSVIGLDHSSAGSMALKSWNFPEILHLPVSRHHLEEKDEIPIVNIIKLANRMTYLIEKGQKDMSDLYSIGSNLLGISDDIFLEILESFDDRFKEYARLFQLEEPLLKPDEGVKEKEAEAERLAERKSAELSFLSEISNAILSGLDIGTVIDMALEGIFRGVGVTRVMLLMVDKMGQTLSFHKGIGPEIESLSRQLRLPLKAESGVLARTVIESKPYNIIDVKSPMYAGMLNLEVVQLLDTNAFATVPLRIGGRTTGVVYVDKSLFNEPITDDEIISIQTFANQISIALSMQGRR
jgi:HD-like signal output (HDOD) protein